MSDAELPVLLVVDDDADTRDLIAALMRKRGYTVETAGSGLEALEMIRRSTIDLVVTDFQMPAMTGVELCRELRARHPDVIAIVLTGIAQLEIAIDSMRAGAFDFITKPVRGEVMEIAVRRALDHQTMRREVKRLRSAADVDLPIKGIAGTSRQSRAMSSTIRRIASSDASVLITGESGTGKELAARALHDLSDRRAEPFVAVNCGAVPPNLLESELFGHRAGAFTDAKVTRPGLFLQAGRGTIFLDEIGELPLDMQVKLLRALQERQVRPVGSDTEVPVHARVISATNLDIETEVEEGRFREDLYYRINVVTVDVPPLRERAGDVIAIAHTILDKIAARSRRAPLALTPAAARKLVEYNWPGNIRELENCLERAVAMTLTERIDVSALPRLVATYESTTFVFDPNNADDMVPLGAMSVRYVKQVLESVGGNKTRAARLLGIDRRSLYRRLDHRGAGKEDGV